MGIHAKARTTAIDRRDSSWSERLFFDLGFDETNPNVQDRNGLTVLHYAVASDHLSLVKKLLENGARVDLRDSEGRTPLHRAASDAMADLLLKAGADIEARDEVGWTPLHKSSRRGRKGAVRALIRHGADVEAVDAELRTPLHKAALRGHKEIVALLLESGANPNAKDIEGNMPISWAYVHGHSQVSEILKRYMAP